MRFASTQASPGCAAQAIDATVNSASARKPPAALMPHSGPRRGAASVEPAIVSPLPASSTSSTFVVRPSSSPPCAANATAANSAARPAVSSASAPRRGSASGP